MVGRSQTNDRIEARVADLKEAYIDDEIDEEQFEVLVEAALDNSAPFRVDWFKKQPETRMKRYTEETVYLYFGEEYIVDGELVRPLDEEIDRTIDVRKSPDLEGQAVYR